MKRVMIGGMMHETNTFNPFLTGLEQYKARQLYCGEEMVSRLRNTNSEIGGFVDALQESDVTIVPSVFANAMPAGRDH